MKIDEFDVVVIGGGPGGSTAATLVAKTGKRVLLLEKAKMPRYSVGESLLPATVHGICKLLGVYDAVDAAGFVKKRGGTFRWGNKAEPWTFSFVDDRVVQAKKYHFALQVERSKFDKLLLDNARTNGVEVIEQAVAETILRDDNGRVRGVAFVGPDGTSQQAIARYVVDAAGNASSFHKQVGERVYSEQFKNLALFGYYNGGKRLAAPDEGNILTVSFERGWFWYIPLSDTLTSVGVVVGEDCASELKDKEAAMDAFISECPMIKEYLAGADRIQGGTYGELRVRKDYSYINTRFAKDGLLLVGDTACFVDPVFSSGVHLATYGALLAARCLNTLFEGERFDEEELFAEFEGRYRREYQVFYDFLLAFYDTNESVDTYYWKARSVLNSKERGNDAFIRLISGGATTADEFFSNREGMGSAFQRTIDDDVTGLSDAEKRHVERVEQTKATTGALTFLGQTGTAAAVSSDTKDGSLIPTDDGLRWTRKS